MRGGQTLQASLLFRLGEAPLLSLFRDALCFRFSSCPLGLLRLFFDELLGARLQLAAQHRNMPQTLKQEILTITTLERAFENDQTHPSCVGFSAPLADRTKVSA